MKILAIDQSIACTAWCIFEDCRGESLTSFGCIKTKKDDGDLHTRVTTICDQIEVLSKQNIDHFVREGLGFGGSKSNASRDLAYLVGAIEDRIGCAFNETPPTSLKKFATGSGKADKAMMIAALPELIREEMLYQGYKKTTGLADLADAYWLGVKFAKSKAGG